MDASTFRSWLAHVEHLTPEQRQEAAAVLKGRPAVAEVTAIIEDRGGAERRCPHCGTDGAVGRGRANGLRRYRCRSCGRSFNALTGTPLAGLRGKDRWLDFAAALRTGETLQTSAERCGVAISTAFRWRHRFLTAATIRTQRLGGIVEADETYRLHSRKGERRLDRPARQRGGRASKRGLSREQVPVLMATDRRGGMVSGVLATASAEAVTAVLAPVLPSDALLVTDGAKCFSTFATQAGMTHEVLNQSAGERVRGDLPIQTVNNCHQRFKDFIADFRGVATKYLSNYVRWFEMVGVKTDVSSRACLQAALGMRAEVGRA
jgi:transposase-like protein